MQIHVFNLHTNLIEADIQRLFSPFGEVDEVILMRDKLNHRSLGRALVEMPVLAEAEQAIVSLNASDVKGKKLLVQKVMYDPAPNASWSASRKA